MEKAGALSLPASARRDSSVQHRQGALKRANLTANPDAGQAKEGAAGGGESSSAAVTTAKETRKRVRSNDVVIHYDHAQDVSGYTTSGRASGQQKGLQFVKQPFFNFSWAKIKRKLLMASTGSPSDGEERGSVTSGTSADSRQQRQQAYALGNKTRPMNPDGTPKQVHMEDDEDADEWSVDQIVVDADYFDDDGNLLHSNESKDGSGTGNQLGERVSNSGRETNTAHSETAGSLIGGPTYKAIDGFITFFRGYLIPKCIYFFEPRFGDEEKEQNFRKERWYNTKRNAWFGSCFLIINWALIMGLSTFRETYAKIMYYGIYSLFQIPLPLMIATDMPRKYPHLYSCWAAIATSVAGWIGIIYLGVCDFLRGGTCSGNMFLSLMFNATVLPFIGLFAMHVSRLWIAAGQVTFVVLVCSLAVPNQPAFARQIVNYLLFSVFIQYLHYSQEKVERRMYTLRTQLKISYRAQQKAQIAEKKANNSKKRFISYIFHEVRVPLNTAYLAFQNLQAGNTFDKKDEDQAVEIWALESSLQQVQQVLNDVLDLQRMDAGRFESSLQPFNFHRAINALVASLKVATTAKKLALDVQLDDRIDKLPQSIDWQGSRSTFVIGDEIRLRQVLTNLASNAVKFSREGRGGISVVTKLIWPKEGVLHTAEIAVSPSQQWGINDITPVNVDENGKVIGFSEAKKGEDGDCTEDTYVARLSREGADPATIDIEKRAGQEVDTPIPLTKRNDSQGSTDSERMHKLQKRECVIVRIEIGDNGPGIRPSDLVDLRLFSPYVQTEVGRTQGGKGSGLGLAIVRAIVQLAGGRLGVQSSNKGSRFWLELRYPLATPSEISAHHEPSTPFSTSTVSTKPVRPGVKPYENGASSWSAYSGSRQEAASNHDGFPVTPIVEKDRPFSPASAHRPPSGSSTGRHRPDSSEVRQGSITLPNNASTSTTAIDVTNPLGSEQWQAPGVVERSLLPSMTVTSPTPPANNSQSTIPTIGRASGRMPSPSPPLPEGVKQRTSTDSDAVRSSPPRSTQAPPVSPPGEEAFTPLTREAVKAMSSPHFERMSPLAEGSTQGASSVRPGTASDRPGTASTTGGDRPIAALVVDDDALTRKLMTRMLSRMGCVVEEAENGQMVVDILLGTGGQPPRYFDIVSLDNSMPVMTGEEAIRIIRMAGRRDFIVGATGNALKSDQASYLAAGVDHILCKPISAKELKGLCEMARKRRADREAAEAATTQAAGTSLIQQ